MAFVTPPGFEPGSREPESPILSIELWGHLGISPKFRGKGNEDFVVMDALLKDIRQCTRCAEELPLGPRPVLSAHPDARILVVGQAPGIRVHESGIPWNDPSGDRLREWLDMDRDTFYNEKKLAIVPSAFCYPGTGKNGDLPPPKICAPTWHPLLLEKMPNIELTLLIGQYAQRYYLGKRVQSNLTGTVRAFHSYLPEFLPLPHPSPRNNIWLKKNPWFVRELLPELKEMVHALL